MLVFLAIYLTEARGLSLGQTGLVLSCYGLGAIVAAAGGGILSDRIGRRPTLVAALMLGAVAMLVLGLMRSISGIALAALGTGLLYELYRPAVSATVADLIPSSDRPRAYSLIYWAVNAGAAIAPILGGVLVAKSYFALFAADAATTFLYGLIVWRALPETRPPPGGGRAQEQSSPGAVLRDRYFLAVCLLVTILCLVFFQSFTTLPLDMRANGLSPQAFGALIAINGGMIVLLQPFAGVWIQGHSKIRTLALASAIIGIGFGLHGLSSSVPWYAVAVMVWTLGEIIYSPAAATLAADRAPVHMRGRYQGVLSMAFSSGFFFAPLLGGWVAGALGFRAVWLGALLLGLLSAAGFLLLSRWRRPLPQS